MNDAADGGHSPMTALQTVRAGLFTFQVYAAMALMGAWFLPAAFLRGDGARRGVRAWCRYARWSARWMVGIETEIRGAVPTGAVLVASKHQSFLDIILLCSVLDRPRFVMKAELTRMPILGWFAMRMGCVPVERGRKGHAVRKMLEDVGAGGQLPGQLVIYPQGTRVAPGVELPYKAGAAILYGDLRQTCVPAATNVGLFWPRRGIAKRPGRAVLEFLDPIPAGLPMEAFADRLRAAVETRSDALMRDAGWRPVNGTSAP